MQPLQPKALEQFKVHWTKERESCQKCKLKVPKVIYSGNKEPLKIYQMFISDVEKCVLFALHLATKEQIVRKKFLVTMSTLTSKLKDKHQELLANIRKLQHELKELEQKFVKVKSDHNAKFR